MSDVQYESSVPRVAELIDSIQKYDARHQEALLVEQQKQFESQLDTLKDLKGDVEDDVYLEAANDIETCVELLRQQVRVVMMTRRNAECTLKEAGMLEVKQYFEKLAFAIESGDEETGDAPVNYFGCTSDQVKKIADDIHFMFLRDNVKQRRRAVS